MKPLSRFQRLLGVGIPLLSACAAAAPTPIGRQDYRGAYVTSRNILYPGDSADVADLVQAAASGVFIRISWRMIEPAPDGFDWSTFDRIATPAIKAGKKLSIGVIAGSEAPGWLAQDANTPYTDFRVAQRGCFNARLYWPWDVRYQNAYLAMLRGLKAHLQAIGGYDNLKIVKISFIAQHTLELRLPRRPAGNYDGCTLGDATAAWIQAGYRPDRVLAGYKRVVSVMAHSIFPDKILSQPTQRGDSFPDIGENGKPAADGTADVALVNAVVQTCLAEAGARCAIQNQSLQSVGPIGDRVLLAKRAGAVIGWQTAMNRRRARCQIEGSGNPNERAKYVPRVPCTEDGFARVLARGTSAGADYLELWPADVRDFPNAVIKAERAMGVGT